MEEKKNLMFTCKYGNEPVDLKLMFLYFARRSRFMIYSIILGAVLFASVYYLKNFVLVEERAYVATGELYLVYADDVRLENVYINDYTWQKLVHTDVALKYAMERIDSDVTEEFLKESVTAGLVSDVRFVTLNVTTHDPELSIEIAQAYQDAIIALGEDMVDIAKVTVFSAADKATEVVSDNRVMRMAGAGAVVGGVLSFFIILLQYLFDDSVYVAGQFERRYSIPVLGMVFKKKKGAGNGDLQVVATENRRVDNGQKIWEQQVIKMNYKVMTGNRKTIAVTDLSIGGDPEPAFEVLQEAKQRLEQDELMALATKELREQDCLYTLPDYRLRLVKGINEDASAAEECSKDDGTILLVPAGAHNDKLVERAVDFLTKQGCNIIGALIYDNDPGLLKAYYFEPILAKRTDKKAENEEEETMDLDGLF